MRAIPESKYIPKIFGNIEELLLLNIKLGHEIDSRVLAWNDSQILGDLFVNSVSTS